MIRIGYNGATTTITTVVVAAAADEKPIQSVRNNVSSNARNDCELPLNLTTNFTFNQI